MSAFLLPTDISLTPSRTVSLIENTSWDDSLEKLLKENRYKVNMEYVNFCRAIADQVAIARQNKRWKQEIASRFGSITQKEINQYVDFAEGIDLFPSDKALMELPMWAISKLIKVAKKNLDAALVILSNFSILSEKQFNQSCSTAIACMVSDIDILITGIKEGMPALLYAETDQETLVVTATPNQNGDILVRHLNKGQVQELTVNVHDISLIKHKFEYLSDEPISSDGIEYLSAKFNIPASEIYLAIDNNSIESLGQLEFYLYQTTEDKPSNTKQVAATLSAIASAKNKALQLIGDMLLTFSEEDIPDPQYFAKQKQMLQSLNMGSSIEIFKKTLQDFADTLSSIKNSGGLKSLVDLNQISSQVQSYLNLAF